MISTMKMPTQTPALKIPVTTWQLLNRTINISNNGESLVRIFFITFFMYIKKNCARTKRKCYAKGLNEEKGFNNYTPPCFKVIFYSNKKALLKRAF
jgi:hypothetical protein